MSKRTRPRGAICRFSALDELPKRASYEEIKAAVLRAGRFSDFDANERPAMFTRLCRDLSLELTDLGYPWTAVTARTENKKGSQS